MNNAVINKIITHLESTYKGIYQPCYLDLDDLKFYSRQTDNLFYDDQLLIRASTQQSLIQVQILLGKPPSYDYQTALMIEKVVERIRGLDSPKLSRKDNREFCDNLEDLAQSLFHRANESMREWFIKLHQTYPLSK